MFTLLISLICFILFICYYHHLFNLFSFPFSFSFILALFLSLPALHVNSLLFIFEIHFICLSLLFEWLYKKTNYKQKKKSLLMVLPLPLILSISFMLYGSYNMTHIVQTEYYIETNKPLSKDKTIVFLSDLHYPTSMNQDKLNQIVHEIEEMNPDIVLLGGDIIDEYTTPTQRHEVFQAFGQLQHTSSIFYVFGNHDTGKHSLHNKISFQELKQCIQSYGIQVLEDESILIQDEILLSGRKDYSQHQRKNISFLIDKACPYYQIILDHQPKDLIESAKKGVDLHLSGHTHAGQIFPLYMFYELFQINELNYGLKEIDQMKAINTSGIAGWGFPIRSENHSEYVIIHLHSTHL